MEKDSTDIQTCEQEYTEIAPKSDNVTGLKNSALKTEISDLNTCEQEYSYAEIAPRRKHVARKKKSTLKTEMIQTSLPQMGTDSITGGEEYTLMAAARRSFLEGKELSPKTAEDTKVKEVTHIATDEEEYVVTTAPKKANPIECSTNEPIYEIGDCITKNEACKGKNAQESSENLYELPDRFRAEKKDTAVKEQDNDSDTDVMDNISLALDFGRKLRTLDFRGSLRKLDFRGRMEKLSLRKKIKYQMVLAIVAIVMAGLALLLTFIQFGTATNAGVPHSWLELVNSSNQEILKFQSSQIVKLQAKQIKLEREMATLVESILNPIMSCKNVTPGSPSGVYRILNSAGNPALVYCDMNRASCSCNTTGGWMRVANLDMTDPNQNCPNRLQLASRPSAPFRTCKKSNNFPTCTSVWFPTNQVSYSSVCGRVIGYQNGTLNGFTPYTLNTTMTIDSAYVDGVILTHGQPQQHVWTFTADLNENCPCKDFTLSPNPVPPFVGTHYFCENTTAQFSRLWDGQGCEGTNACCGFNNPPWFCKQLPQPTTDDIELRICSGAAGIENGVLLEIADIYVQ